MTIRQLRNPASGWDFCAGVLPHKINPTDIDLCIEHRGHFLILEGKQPDERPMPEGQARFLAALAALPQFTVVQFVGIKPDEIHSAGRWGKEQRPMTTEELNAEIYRWYEWVRKQSFDLRNGTA